MLGTSDTAPESHVMDSTDATFMQDVIEASNTQPVIVDFWAPWCGPCKTLGPAIEAAVNKAGGRVKLVKVDVDANQGYASQLRVQSIPTVYAFHNGQPVDGFQGALPPSEIDAFVEKVAALAGEPDNGLDDAVTAAEEMLAEGDVAGAAETFAAILQEDANHAAAYGGLVRSYIALGDLDQAEAVLNGAPAEIAEASEVEAARAQLDLARQAQSAGPLQELMDKVAADPTDKQARLDLAVAMHANGDAKEAIDVLLALFKMDREWNDGAAKAQLMTIFDAMPANDPVVLNGRRKLSSMIFA